MDTQSIKLKLAQLQNTKTDILDLRIMMLGHINDLIAYRSQNRDEFENAIRNCQSLYREIPVANSFITTEFQRFKERFSFLLSQIEHLPQNVSTLPQQSYMQVG